MTERTETRVGSDAVVRLADGTLVKGTLVEAPSLVGSGVGWVRSHSPLTEAPRLAVGRVHSLGVGGEVAASAALLPPDVPGPETGGQTANTWYEAREDVAAQPVGKDEAMPPELTALVDRMLDHAIEATDRMHRTLDETIRYLRAAD